MSIPLPQPLADALEAVGLRGFDDLARATGYQAQTLRVARCRGEISPAMAARVGKVLGVSPLVAARLLMSRRAPR